MDKLKNLKGYALPIIMGIVTIITGINEQKAQKRNEELEAKIDALNSKLDEE